MTDANPSSPLHISKANAEEVWVQRLGEREDVFNGVVDWWSNGDKNS